MTSLKQPRPFYVKLEPGVGEAQQEGQLTQRQRVHGDGVHDEVQVAAFQAMEQAGVHGDSDKLQQVQAQLVECRAR